METLTEIADLLKENYIRLHLNLVESGVWNTSSSKLLMLGGAVDSSVW